MEDSRPRHRPARLHWLIILLAAVAARAALALIFSPLVAPDTSSYVDTAAQLAGGDYSAYIGARPPVYPLLIHLLGYSVERIVLFQHLAGIAVALLLYEVFHRITGSRRLALAAGISQAVNPFQVVIEQALLSEAFTALLVASTVALYVLTVDRLHKLPYAFATGVAAGLSGLSHPQFVFLPFLAAFGLGLKSWLEGRRLSTAAMVAAAVLPGALLLGGWCAFNYSKISYFGLTTTVGVNLITHTGAFIQDAPERYEKIRRVYLENRRIEVAQTGRQPSTIFRAMKDLERTTNMDYVALSRELTRLSVTLILRNPLKYLRSMARSFARFWLPAWYTGQGGVRAVMRSGEAPMILLVGTFTLVHLWLSLLFLLLPLLCLFGDRLKMPAPFDFRLIGVYVLVFSAAVFQALINNGDNPRYELPVEPFVMAVGAVALVLLIKRLKAGLPLEKYPGEDQE
ncbi:MAG: glycosyltransferase family 39 protein [Candidatus Glassbacteria bacterium]